jgi:glycosyltransferase, group 4 family
MRAGMTQHQALISIVTLSLIFIIINLSLFNQLLVTWIIAINIIIYIAFHYTIDIFIRRKGGLPFTE